MTLSRRADRDRAQNVGLVIWLAILAMMGSPGPSLAQSPIAEPGPRTPSEERSTMTLPEGFEIQLFASEPQIQKPMNLAFDSRGRLWVTTSTEYPLPSPADQPGRDRVTILEDTDGDGRADQVTHFADDLKIPIGLYPYRDGVIVFTIPEVVWLRDLDGDDRADHREVLYGPFDTSRDTHGMNNGFRRGLDGWLYANHGFNNQSDVTAGDGSSVQLNSGSTYRMGLGRSRIEPFTHGQVNPFGMTWTRQGDLLNADCHTKPITLLIRGGWYEQFGAPHDGLGFVPPVMDHGHGSTAIAGCCFYEDIGFPEPYRDAVFTGNVVTHRVHADRLIEHGSSLRAEALPDLLTSSDPWFRPVDIRLGPDGSLYVADFYNRIIGHYEVPLDHPGRDRHRGRIWRITYRGSDRERMVPNLRQADTNLLIRTLGHPNRTLRMRATDELADRVGGQAEAALRQAYARPSESSSTRVHTLWLLHRLDVLEEELLVEACGDDDPLLRIHAMRILAERSVWSSALASSALRGLRDPNGFVRRAAAGALAAHPRRNHVDPLIHAIATADPGDIHLRHALRIALRDQLAGTGSLEKLAVEDLTEIDLAILTEILPGLQEPASGEILLAAMARQQVAAGDLPAILKLAAETLPVDQLDRLADVARWDEAELPDRLARVQAIRAGCEGRGIRATPRLAQSTDGIVAELLDLIESSLTLGSSWTFLPAPTARSAENPWVLKRFRTAQSDEVDLISSLPPGGEQLTGTLRSVPFSIPDRLEFEVAGHLGHPGQPGGTANLVRLVDAKTGRILAQALAPRSDLSHHVTWDLQAHRGRSARLEIIDGMAESAYAWIAAGAFEPQVITLPARSPRQLSQTVMEAASLALWSDAGTQLTRWRSLLLHPAIDPWATREIARLLAGQSSQATPSALIALLDRPELDPDLRRAILQALAEEDFSSVDDLIGQAMRAATAEQQARLAIALAGSREGGIQLIRAIEQGSASPWLLRSSSLRERLIAAESKIESRVEALLVDLPEPSHNRTQRIAQVRSIYREQAGTWSTTIGASVFDRRCASCHRIGDRGRLVGPQLDGIDRRGLDRLLEDLFDPNRNVDVAFQTRILALGDGRVLSGLVRHETDRTLTLVNPLGEELTVAIAEVEESRQTRQSLMPEDLAISLNDEEIYHLLEFLLNPAGQADRSIP